MDQTALFDFVLRKQDDLVSFALGLPDPELFPVAELAAVATSVFDGSPDVYQYTSPLDELRGHIARLMAMRGVACTPEQIVLTNGAQHGIDMAVRLLRRQTDVVIVDEVTYSGALSALSTLDMPIRTIPAARAGGGMPDAVAGVLGGEDHLSFIYVMPEGHNPLGTSIPASDRPALVALAREHAFGIVEDDAYGFLQYGHAPRAALRALDDRWVVYIGSFSKIISPGLRVGWIVIPDELAAAAAAMKEASALDVATPGQYLVAGLLDRWDLAEHIRVLVREYGRRRDAMQRWLAEIVPSGTVVSRPDSGMFFWVELPGDVDTTNLLKIAVEKYGVSFVPGGPYFADPAKAKRNCLRLSFSCVPEAGIATGMERLEHLFAGQGIT